MRETEVGGVSVYFLLLFCSTEQGLPQSRCLEMCVERMTESINQTSEFLTMIRLRDVHTPSALAAKKATALGIPDSLEASFHFLLPWEFSVNNSCDQLEFSSRSVPGYKRVV